MYTAKRISAFLLSIILILCSVAVSFAEETIGVSLSASETTTKKTVTTEQSGTFTLYLGADKFAVGEKILNTYEFTVWYNEKYVKVDDEKIADASKTDGYALLGDKTEKNIDGVKYTGQTFTYVSYEKGFGEATGDFNALAEIPFKATTTTGTTNILITPEDITLLPVVTGDAFKDTLAASVLNSSVKVTVEAGESGGSPFGGNGNVMAVKRTVVFDVDGAKTSVTIADGKKVAKPDDPVKNGYTFLGWYNKQTDELFDFNSEIVESVELIAKFIENGQASVSSLPFTDVKEADWFYAGVKYVFEQNMVKGISETLYGPDNTLTRATMVTLLYRMENEPSAPANVFSDVASGSWYENAVAWAADKEIVLGIGEGKFAPDVNITREQIAVILYKYTKVKGGDVSKTVDLNGFTDSADVSEWAKEALSWAVAEGLIQGMGDGAVAPGATATRAQIATILMRYMQ